MCRLWWRGRAEHRDWKRHSAIHVVALVICVLILAVTVAEKFFAGAWKTLVVTAATIGACVLVRAHYRSVARKVAVLSTQLLDLPASSAPGGEPDPRAPTAVLLVSRFGGLGVHCLLALQRTYPGYFQNVVFVSVAVVDSGAFKGEGKIDNFVREVQSSLDQYVAFARRLGWNASSRIAIGTHVVAELEQLCRAVVAELPRAVIFGGKLVWKRDAWYQRLLHNETAFQLQRRLAWEGIPMTVLPVRVPAST